MAWYTLTGNPLYRPGNLTVPGDRLFATYKIGGIHAALRIS